MTADDALKHMRAIAKATAALMRELDFTREEAYKVVIDARKRGGLWVPE